MDHHPDNNNNDDTMDLEDEAAFTITAAAISAPAPMTEADHDGADSCRSSSRHRRSRRSWSNGNEQDSSFFDNDNTTTREEMESSQHQCNNNNNNNNLMLNASFDASLLTVNANRKAGHPSSSSTSSSSLLFHHASVRPRAATSWDENDNRGGSSGAMSMALATTTTTTREQQQHHQQLLQEHQFSIVMPELPVPRTVSKSKSTGSTTTGAVTAAAAAAATAAAVVCSSTPIRLRFRGGGPPGTLKKTIVGKLTPAKRHKAPLLRQQRPSPSHRVSSHMPHHHHYHAGSLVGPTSSCLTNGLSGSSPNNNNCNHHNQHRESDDFSPSSDSTDTNDNNTPLLFGSYTIKKTRAPKTSLSTTATAASSTITSNTMNSSTTHYGSLLETTTETIESSGDITTTSEASSSTPFRFTTFPASLPRINNNPRTTTATTINTAAFASSSALAALGGDDDGDGERNAMHPPSCPATVRKRMSFGEALRQQHHHQQQQHNNNMMNRSRDNDDATHNSSISSSLLLDDHCHHDHGLNYDDDEEYDNHHHHHHHDDNDNDDDDDHNVNVDIDDILNNGGGGGGGGSASPVPVGTPVPRTRLNFSSVLSSPIVQQQLQQQQQQYGGHAEGERDDFDMQIEGDQVDLNHPNDQKRIGGGGGGGEETLHGASVLDSAMSPARPTVTFGKPKTPREVKLHFQLDAAQCSPIPGIPEEDGDGSSKSGGVGGGAFSSSARKSAHNSLSSSRDSTGSDKSSTTRKSARPMPDMNAFEGDSSACSRDRSLDDSKSSGGSTNNRAIPQSPKLLCPPTPVRTPAWAHSESAGHPMFKAGGLMRYGRSNSLIQTKVLAKCSPQMLDERASLENSSLEEGNSTESHDRSLTKAKPKNGDESDDVAVDAVVEEAEDAPMATDNNNNEDWLHNARSTTKQKRGSVEGGPLVVSMATHFDVLSTLGRGAFADVYRVRSKVDGRLYAVKRNRRQFRGTRDREKALAEVRCMQRLQSVCTKPDGTNLSNSLFLLFFFQAWQEDGHFFCQTELCCRDTCCELMDSLRFQWTIAITRYPSLNQLPPPPSGRPGTSQTEGRLVPESTIWKICHDVIAGLCHIHAHGLVHFDIKPSNLFLVPHGRLGALCKIGDFGMAGEIGSSEDGQEGDQKYMAPELLSSGQKHPSADTFSLGLTLYELASSLSFVLPSEGARWHEVRSGRHSLDIPPCRSSDLIRLIGTMLRPARDERPTADAILATDKVAAAGMSCDQFLRDYIMDIENYDARSEQQSGSGLHEDQTPRHTHATRVCSPSALANFLPQPPLMYSPEATSS